MDKKTDTRKKIINAVIMLIVIAGMILAAHMLIYYFNIAEIISKIHGG